MLRFSQKNIVHLNKSLIFNGLIGCGTKANSLKLTSNFILNQFRNNPVQLRFNSTSTFSSNEDTNNGLKESILWFDNVFPIKMSRFDFRTFFLSKTKQKSIMEKAKESLLPVVFPSYFELNGIEPSIKEGGLFIRYSYNGEKKEILKAINDHLNETKPRCSYNFQRVKMYEVEGVPFVEDVDSIYPNTKLNITFKGGPSLDTETIFRHFRKFGSILDIVIDKDGNKASVIFKRKRSATSAKNCLNDCVIGNTRITIQYANLTSVKTIYRLFSNHPRILFPLTLASFIAFGYYVLDPIRIFFITNKITGKYNYSKGYHSRRRRKNLLNPKNLVRILASSTSNDDYELSDEQEENLKHIKNYLKETPETFMLVTGPTGSGKTELVQALIKDTKNYVIIDCEALMMQPDSNKMLNNFANQIGLFPSIISSGAFSNIADTAMMASIGQKTSLSSNTASNFNEMLEVLGMAINKINEDFEKKTKGQPADEITHNYPVIIIQDYMGKEKSRHQFIYSQLAEWASSIIENQTAHIIFVSPNSAALKKLSSNVPNKSIKNIILSDASPSDAMAYVKRRISQEEDIDVELDEDLKYALSKIGGRMQDLESYTQKIKAGLNPKDAFNDLLNEVILELRKKGFGDDEEDISKMKWSPIQFWKIVQALGGDSEEISYDNIRFHDIFSGDENPIRAMEENELISIIYKNGRPYSIRAYRPLYQTGFKKMLLDTRLSSSMCVVTSKYLIEKETRKIRNEETELDLLVRVLSGKHNGEGVKSRSNRQELEKRIETIISIIRESNNKCNRWQKEGRTCKNLLKSVLSTK